MEPRCKCNQFTIRVSWGTHMGSRATFLLVATQRQSTGSGMVPGLSKNYSVNVGLLVFWLTVDRRHCGVMKTTGSKDSNLPLLNPPNSNNACFFSLIWYKYNSGHKQDGEKLKPQMMVFLSPHKQPKEHAHHWLSSSWIASAKTTFSIGDRTFFVNSSHHGYHSIEPHQYITRTGCCS